MSLTAKLFSMSDEKELSCTQTDNQPVPLAFGPQPCTEDVRLQFQNCSRVTLLPSCHVSRACGGGCGGWEGQLRTRSVAAWNEMY